ncbi:GGDEF domain-containing protein, partial [Myxococcota bacterium]|nr:GGDEF domain-containing protein [Myxococcota bacterium]
MKSAQERGVGRKTGRDTGRKIGRKSGKSARGKRISGQGQWTLLLKIALHSVLDMLLASAGVVLTLTSLTLVVFGVFRDLRGSTTPQLLALSGLLILLISRLVQRLQQDIRTRHNQMLWRDLELGGLFVAAAFPLIELTGGPAGYLYPFIYALVAFLVAFNPYRLSAALVVLILLTEALLVHFSGGGEGWRLYASHASFIFLFAFISALFVRGQVKGQSANLDREIDGYIKDIMVEAKSYRLTSGIDHSERNLSISELKERRTISSIEAIKEALYSVLMVAEHALSPYTVALFWVDDSGQYLKLRELRSESDYLREEPISVAEGFLGAVTKRKEKVVLTNLKPGHSGLVYYSRPEAVTDFVGVPLLENERHLRGVLVADRKDNQPFTDADVDVLNTLAKEILRAVDVERIFMEMDRKDKVQTHFARASTAFNNALTLDEVVTVALDLGVRTTDVDFVSVVVATDNPGEMRIAEVHSANKKETDRLEAKIFDGNAGLVGAAIKARSMLPYNSFRSAKQPVFTPAIDVPYKGIRVFPMIWKDQGVGALVLGSNKEKFLNDDTILMLRSISNHAAIAIANAQMYQKMETMATTDGLTGLTNHRHFQQRFDEMLARSSRYSRKLAFILTDIDHFKSVNDTYGHPVGDKVLKVISRLMLENARRTDVVAR